MVCDRWDSFHAFVADMGPRAARHTLDRIDNDKGYSPENCRWADRHTQQMNRRNAVFVEVEGVQYRADDLAKIAKVKPDTIIERAGKGWPYKKVVSRKKASGGDNSRARSKTLTHCKNGHEYTPTTVLLTKEGWRACRVCHTDRQRERKHKRDQAAPI